MFILGLITGLLISLVVLVVSVALRGKDVVTKVVQIAEKHTKPTGGIFEPQSEADAAREMIIQRNREQGLDTKFEDLI